MYNRLSRASGITAIIAAALMFGFLLMLPILGVDWDGLGLAAVFLIIFVIIAYILIYICAIPYFIVALVYGIRILKQQDRKKLIAFNKSLLIATCVLLPFLAFSIIFGINFTFAARLNLTALLYTVLLGCAYLASLITSIVSLVLLKKAPEQTPPQEEQTQQEPTQD